VSALAAPERSPETLFDATGGEPMLDELLVGVWEGLTAHRVVECPVCAAEMEPVYGVHSLPIGWRCVRCGSTLG
jgi:hypothetical protein